MDGPDGNTLIKEHAPVLFGILVILISFCSVIVCLCCLELIFLAKYVIRFYFSSPRLPSDNRKYRCGK